MPSTNNKPALFLDRDGVLNELILNPKTGEYESPHEAKDLRVYPTFFSSLEKLASHFQLFVVSNQPSFAKGKTSLEAINEIAQRFADTMAEHNILITEYYYCLHHTDGNVPGYSVRCECRKPSPFFLKQAAAKYQLDLSKSWMVGDRDSDVECGQSAGCQTVLIENVHSKKKQGHSKPTFKATNLETAGEKILLSLPKETL